MSTPRSALLHLVADLRREGFGSDAPVIGADVVDCINRHWPELDAIAKTPPSPLTSLEQELTSLLASFTVRHERFTANPDEWTDMDQLCEAQDVERARALLDRAGVKT